jgi:hypothetical protein
MRKCPLGPFAGNRWSTARYFVATDTDGIPEDRLGSRTHLELLAKPCLLSSLPHLARLVERQNHISV